MPYKDPVPQTLILEKINSTSKSYNVFNYIEIYLGTLGDYPSDLTHQLFDVWVTQILSKKVD